VRALPFSILQISVKRQLSAALSLGLTEREIIHGIELQYCVRQEAIPTQTGGKSLKFVFSVFGCADTFDPAMVGMFLDLDLDLALEKDARQRGDERSMDMKVWNLNKT
jgi:hypothetical protein